MSRPRTALLLTLLALAACAGQKKPAPVAAPPAVAARSSAAPVAQEAKSAAPEPPAWTYSSAGKRDPFKSFLSDVESAQAVVTRCSTPLGKFEIDQLRLVAVVTGLDDPVAMVEAPNGIGYNLRRGVCIGRNGGVVASVRSGEVVISEWVIKADGSRDKTQTFLRLPREAALQIEE